jgi:hypothetical protein
MNRLISALAATSVLGIAAPAAAQSMQGMEHAGHDDAYAGQEEAGGKGRDEGQG